MPSFKDLQGRDWPLVITHGDAKRVRAALNVDLYKLLENKGEGYKRILEDVDFFVSILYQLLKPAADTAAVTQEQFEAALSGEQLSDAENAFDEAFANFCRDRTQREAMRQVVMKKKAVQVKMEKRALTEVNRKMDQAEQTAMAALEAELNGSSITVPESSESIPIRLASAN